MAGKAANREVQGSLGGLVSGLCEPSGEGAAVPPLNNDWWNQPVPGWREGRLEMRDSRRDELVTIYLREEEAWRNQGIDGND
jgi:hypothetical protein